MSTQRDRTGEIVDPNEQPSVPLPDRRHVDRSLAPWYQDVKREYVSADTIDAFIRDMWPEKPKRKRAPEPERKQASDEGDDFDRGEQ